MPSTRQIVALLAGAAVAAAACNKKDEAGKVQTDGGLRRKSIATP